MVESWMRLLWNRGFMHVQAGQRIPGWQLVGCQLPLCQGKKVHVPDIQAGEDEASIHLPSVLRRAVQRWALGVEPMFAPVQPLVEGRRQLKRLDEPADDLCMQGRQLLRNGHRLMPPCEGS